MLLVAVGAFGGLGVEAAARLAARASGSPSSTRAGCCRCPAALVGLAAGHRLVVTVEDGGRSGGVGAAVADALLAAGATSRCEVLALPQRVPRAGCRAELLGDLGLTAQAVARGITEWARRCRPVSSRRSAHQPAGRARLTSAAGASNRQRSRRAMRVLVVEDEQRLADAIARGLRAEGMAVDVAYDGEEGHEKATFTRYDVVVLDRDLPGMHGDELLRRDRRPPGRLTRVLMLTASGTVDDRVTACRWAPTTTCPSRSPSPNWWPGCGRSAAGPPRRRRRCCVAGDLELDPARRTVARAGRPVELTRKEFGVLEVLLRRRGAVVSSEELLERVWDENADPFTTTVRVTMMTLRRKLGEPGLIDTVVGAGYRVPAAG